MANALKQAPAGHIPTCEQFLSLKRTEEGEKRKRQEISGTAMLSL
jgi:hypothetical protein